MVYDIFIDFFIPYLFKSVDDFTTETETWDANVILHNLTQILKLTANFPAVQKLIKDKTHAQTIIQLALYSQVLQNLEK